MAATGISMGGLVLGNYLSRQSEDARKLFTACLIISVPWDVQKGSTSIEKPYLNNLLGKHLTSRLCHTLSKYEILNKSRHDIDFDTILKSKTIKEFDANFTSKHFGYKDVDHYYSVATLHNKLDKIAVPLLCLSAADDPFQPLEGESISILKFARDCQWAHNYFTLTPRPQIPYGNVILFNNSVYLVRIKCFLSISHFEAIPTRAAEESSHVAILVTARGGHIGERFYSKIKKSNSWFTYLTNFSFSFSFEPGFMEGFWPKTNDEYVR